MANSYLSRTPSSAGNRQKWTWSAWVKFSQTPGAAGATLFSAYAHGNDNFNINLGDTNQISMRFYNGTEYQLVPNRRFRDFSAWYHLVFAVDTTLATAADRFKIYVNGVRETSFSNEDQPTQNLQMTINDTTTMQIGRYSTGSNFFDGYMSHVSLVDGQALTPTSFGETDSTSGIWKFKSPSGLSWGTNGVHLKFENSGNLGLDSSGQTNNFTVNGDLKQSLDTPSNNHCIINPLHNKNGGTFSNGNTRYDGLSGSPYDAASGGSLGFNKGKWYWEWKWGLTGSGNQAAFVGIIDSGIEMVQGGNPSKGVTYRPDAGSVRKDGSEVSSAYSGSENDIFGMAFDMDAGTLKLHKNGTYFNSGNAVVTGIDLTKTYLPYIGPNGGTTVSNIYMNWGNGYFGTTAITSAGSNGNGSLFEYDVPSGHYALNTKNINTHG